MAVTMRDVAAKAGVSPVVVSRVLHNKATSIRVSEATADRVREAAKELGYRCNVFARNFRAQQTMMIGVLHGIGFDRPKFNHGSRYFAALMDGIVEGAFHHGYSVTLCPQLLGSTPEDAMADGRFDGLVWYSTIPSEASRQMIMRCSIPLVLVHARTSEFAGRYPTVICDNDQGIRLSVNHLYELGHRSIAYGLDCAPLNSESLVRLESFRAHMRRLGLQTDDSDLLAVGAERAEIHEYLQNGPRHTAIVACNDELASGFFRAAPKYGITIPDDLSIVGFDSTAYCEEMKPGLTSVSQPLTDMGRRAIELLIQAIAGDDIPPPEVVFPCGLDVRESTMSIAEQVNQS